MIQGICQFFLWLQCLTSVGLIFKSHDFAYLVFIQPAPCQAIGLWILMSTEVRSLDGPPRLYSVLCTTVTWTGALARCPRLTQSEFIYQLFGKGRGTPQAEGWSINSYSPSGASHAIFNFDFKATCQIPVYKSMVEMILMVSNRSNRLSVLGLGYTLDLVIAMSSSQPAQNSIALFCFWN